MSAVVTGVLVAAVVLVAALPRAGRRPAPGGGRSGAAPGAAAARWGRASGTRAVTRRRRDVVGRSPLDPAFVLDLCGAAVRGGVPVATALVAMGRHLGGAEGEALVRAGTALSLGATWDSAWAGAPPSVVALGDALHPGWEAGASPGPQLRAAADRLRRERRARLRAAAGALGVRLTLPLGVCFLPAFVLLGLAPVVLGLAGDLVATGV